MTISHVCVFCGSNTVDNPGYIQAAEELGRLIAGLGKKLVYGGGNRGLMGTVAKAAKEQGGYVIGVTPQRFSRHSIDFSIDENIQVASMHDRKAKMYSLSQAFIILPGGIGTLDEFSEIFTWLQLKLSNKAVILLNVDGFFDSLTSFLDRMIADGFLKQSQRDLLIVTDTIDSIPDILDSYRAPFEEWKPD